MLPVTPTTSGENRPRQAAGHGLETQQRVGHGHDGNIRQLGHGHLDVEAGRPVGLAHKERSRPGRDGFAQEALAVGCLAWQGDEDVAGRNCARVDGCPRMNLPDERINLPPVAAAISAAVRADGPAPGRGSRWRVSVTLPSVAQPTAHVTDLRHQPSGLAFCPPGGGGPFLLAGM